MSVPYEWFKGYIQTMQYDAYDKESAAKEKMWKNAAKTEGLQIWRIQNLRVTSWPKTYYGKFYDGDSYIILQTDSQKRCNVHTWIGKYSTEDEFTTATFKMIQLCTYLDDKPIQHREAQGRESKLFKSYFNEITYLYGGAPSSLADKEAEGNKSRLFHFHGEKLKATVIEIPMDPNKIDDDDVYILDKNSEIIQWNGKGCNNGEKAAASRYVQKLKSERTGKSVKVDVIDQRSSGSRMDEFFQAMKVCSKQLQEQKDKEDRVMAKEREKELRKDADDKEHEVLEGEGEKGFQKDKEEKENFDYSSDVIDFDPKDKTHELYRLSDASGEMEFTQIKTGDDIEMSDFDEQDVFIYDTKETLFVWIGQSTSKEERNKCMTYAHTYLSKTDHPIIPVTCLRQGEETAAFISSLKKR